jgi:2,3-bisphosphoglycerate-dependent phosphoglycerate mutase
VTLLLVRHAEPVAPGIAGYEENERPLSEAGRTQSLRLAERLAGAGITAIYSSPYPRARQTVEPLAERLRLPVAIVPDLRERLLGTGPLPDWLGHVERSWADFSYALEGGESAAEAQARVWRVLEPLAERHRSQVAVVASHGNLIALALHRIVAAGVDVEFWRAMPMPAVYWAEPDGRVTGPGLKATGAAAADRP